jgi:hypothetical protein
LPKPLKQSIPTVQDGEDTGFFIFSAGQDVTEQFLSEPVQACRQTPDALPVRASAVPACDDVSAAQACGDDDRGPHNHT